MTRADDRLETRLVDRAKQLDLEVPPDAAKQLADYLRLLAHWNKTINLTALPLDGFPDQSLDRLIMEPLAAAPSLENRPESWFDIGSGGGSPAIPLKLVRPALRLTMIESKERKSAFLREAARSLGMSETVVLTSRFEDLADGQANLVTIRAVKVNETLYAAAAKLLHPNGRLLLFGTGGDRIKVASPWSVETTESLPTGSLLTILKRSA